MVKAFVFGKFLPFHKGHEAMINFAMSKCEFLSVLVCVSDKEKISGSIRKNWIVKTFYDNSNIEVIEYYYRTDQLTNESKASLKVSEDWSEIFKDLFPDYSILVTSEEYGKMVAEFMNIKHILYDIERNHVNISATYIRENIFKNWNYLPDSVKPYFTLKVVIVGTESTGKTTLAEKLAKHFNCGLVLEAAREIIANSNSFTFDDLYIVAKEHAKRIDKTIFADSPLVIIDTDIHTTKSYSRFTFEKELEINANIYNSSKASLYLYLNNDVEHLQDGARLSEAARNLLDLSHRQVLTDHDIDFIEIRGDWDERFDKAVEQINKLIVTNGQKHWA
ncbi:MAG: adenylyltransferase/cytidyltransferase family protein [Candidatus Staskawiczbacteria bacterium]|nr:adenylyltransferase/cytidyltransferase family protein [Candidatus Staskawiczbacteria bacterium]